MQVNKLHLNCGTEGGYPGGIQRVNILDSRVDIDKYHRRIKFHHKRLALQLWSFLKLK